MDNIPYQFIIDVKVPMCNMVTNTFYLFPWNFGTENE